MHVFELFFKSEVRGARGTMAQWPSTRWFSLSRAHSSVGTWLWTIRAMAEKFRTKSFYVSWKEEDVRRLNDLSLLIASWGCSATSCQGRLAAVSSLNMSRSLLEDMSRNRLGRSSHEERYTYIYALDRAIEGTIGAFGQPAVGWLTAPFKSIERCSFLRTRCSSLMRRARTMKAAPRQMPTSWPKAGTSWETWNVILTIALVVWRGIFTVASVGFSICFLFYCAWAQ